jgi:hypothetical protein
VNDLSTHVTFDAATAMAASRHSLVCFLDIFLLILTGFAMPASAVAGRASIGSGRSTPFPGQERPAPAARSYRLGNTHAVTDPNRMRAREKIWHGSAIYIARGTLAEVDLFQAQLVVNSSHQVFAVSRSGT